VENLASGRLGNLLPKGGLLATPRRTFLVGMLAVLLAAVLLLVYLRNYRNSVKSTSAPVIALVAKRFIPAGTTNEALAKNGLYEVTVISKGSLKDGAITDAAVLKGQVALTDINPGQQLTVLDFGVTSTSSSLSGVLAPKTRAIAIPLDAHHGITPQVQTGDRVDVWAQVNGVLGLLRRNVLVLAAPNQVASGSAAPISTNFTFQVAVRDAPRFAWASENGTIWLTLRPQKQPAPTRQVFISAGNLFGGS
jgi:Flp pilus assembly protein CpaB